MADFNRLDMTWAKIGGEAVLPGQLVLVAFNAVMDELTAVLLRLCKEQHAAGVAGGPLLDAVNGICALNHQFADGVSRHIGGVHGQASPLYRRCHPTWNRLVAIVRQVELLPSDRVALSTLLHDVRRLVLQAQEQADAAQANI